VAVSARAQTSPPLKPNASKIPRIILGKLAGLAGVSESEEFPKALTRAVREAHRTSQQSSTHLTRTLLVKRIDDLIEAALQLKTHLEDLQDKRDSAALIVGDVIFHAIMDPLQPRQATRTGTSRKRPFSLTLAHLSAILEAAKEAKSNPIITLNKERGRPAGKGGSHRFESFLITLELAALNGGGDWTLNKNDERGTLIDALELLRNYLPNNFLPKKNKHPFSSYQILLTRLRGLWKAGFRFETIEDFNFARAMSILIHSRDNKSAPSKH
jgi:hypothetical protein